jgi:truncated hemoglobin YjbI
MTDYERLGGDAVLTPALTDFVQRMAGDFIIGWLFEGRDLQAITRHEISFATAHLGGGGTYAGRPLGKVHQALPINRGMFRRRLSLLRTVLLEHGLPDDVVERWMAHDERLLPVISNGAECTPDAVDDPSE